jgi:hypothetical protein
MLRAGLDISMPTRKQDEKIHEEELPKFEIMQIRD